jgi:hypothetical protein
MIGYYGVGRSWGDHCIPLCGELSVSISCVKLTDKGIERVDYNAPLGLEDTAEIMDLLDGYDDISDGFAIQHNVAGMHEHIEILSAYCEG